MGLEIYKMCNIFITHQNYLIFKKLDINTKTLTRTCDLTCDPLNKINNNNYIKSNK